MIFSLIISLLLTIIIEISTSFLQGIRKKDDLEIVLWANILTNPVVVYIANCVKLLKNDSIYNMVVITMEIIVVFVEYKLFEKYLEYRKKSPFLISLVNNVTSFGLGIIINKLIFF